MIRIKRVHCKWCGRLITAAVVNGQWKMQCNDCADEYYEDEVVEGVAD